MFISLNQEIGSETISSVTFHGACLLFMHVPSEIIGKLFSCVFVDIHKGKGK